MAKYKRVFQMGFDIAEREDVSNDELEDLFLYLEDCINNYKFKETKGEPPYFKSVGCENTEDMSHAYGEKELKQINEDEYSR